MYTRLSTLFVKPLRTLVSGWRFPAGNKPASRKNVSQGPVGRLADTNPRGDLDLSCAKAVVSNPQARVGRGEVASVVALARDAEGFRQASGAAGKANQIAGALHRDLSRPRHFLDALQRFQSAEKHSPGLSVGLTRHVQAIVVAVDEVNVGVAGWSEQHRSAGGLADERVGSGVILSKVSLDLDDAASQARLSAVTHQHLAKKFAGHAPRIAGEKGAVKRVDGRLSMKDGQGSLGNQRSKVRTGPF